MVKVLSLHAGQITRYGSSVGVRDLGLLEAALYSPQTEYYAGLIEEAAARWERLALSHPFIDGNKRVGFAVIYTFLTIKCTHLTAAAAAAAASTSTFIQASVTPGPSCSRISPPVARPCYIG